MENESNLVVYAVTESSGEGPLVQGVFSTESLAKLFLEEYRDKQNSENIYIAEWYVDEKVGYRAMPVYRVTVDILSGVPSVACIWHECLPDCGLIGNKIEIGWEGAYCLAWSTVSSDHARELALDGRSEYLRTSASITS